MTLQELQDRRHTLAREARSILDRASAESRSLTQEDRTNFDRADREITDIDRRIAAASFDEDRSGGDLAGRDLAGNLDPGRSGSTRQTPGFALGERRMGDWCQGRGVRSDFSPDDAAGFSLGRLVQRMAGYGAGNDEVERRALAAGADATGGVLVPEPLAAFVIDRIRPRTRVLEAGATVVPMDSDELSIPRIVSGVQGGWRAENAPVVVEDLAFSRVKLVARTNAVLVKLPMEMWEDLRPEGAQAIENELNQALASALDGAALRGSGVAPEPRGVRNTPGVEVISLGANGAQVTNFDPLVRAVAGVMRDSFDPNAAIYSPRTWETFALLKDTTNQPLQRPTLPDGFRELVSAKVPDDLTQGTALDASEIYVGAWGNLLIGVRPTIGVRIKPLDQTFAGNMQMGLLCWLRADCAVTHGEAFSVVTGVRAAA